MKLFRTCIRRFLPVFVLQVWLALSCHDASAGMIGAWQFNNSLVNDISGGSSASLLGSFAPGNYVNATINGETARVLSFPRSQSIADRLGIPNDTGANMPVFSVLADFRLDSMRSYSGFLDVGAPTTTGNTDYYILGQGIILGGQNTNPGFNFVISSPGVFRTDTWHRVALTNDANDHVKIYVDGTLVAAGTRPTGYFRGGFVHSSGFSLFTDDDRETSRGSVNSVAFFDNVLSEADIKKFGGPTASGITAVPEPSSLILLCTAGAFVRIFRLRRKGKLG